MAGTSSQQVAADRQLEVVERVTGRQLREALLEVGTHLGWDHQTVICISETVTGRAWQRCRADDVIRVARVLLEVASALRSASQGRVDSCCAGEPVGRHRSWRW